MMRPLNYVISTPVEREGREGWRWEEKSAAEAGSDGIIGYINLAKAKYLYRAHDRDGVTGGATPDQQNP